MRSHIRYLPAALPLVLPLAVLAFLGSSEFSRLQQRAEVSLRERAFDLLELASTRFNEQLDAMTAKFVTPAMSTDFPDLESAARTQRERHPHINEMVVLRSTGSLGYPRRRQINMYPWMRERRSVMSRLERDGGSLDEHEKKAMNRTMGPDRSGSRARFERIMLAELCQKRDDPERAHKHYSAVLQNILDHPDDPDRRPRRGRIDSRTIYELGSRIGLIETCEAPSESPEIGPVLQKFCAGDYSDVPAELVMDALKRLQPFAQENHGEAFALAAQSAEEQIRHYQFSCKISRRR